MFNIYRERKGYGPIEDVVYTEAEAKEKGIDYIEWNKVTKAGQWLLTQDKYVAKVREVRRYKDRKGEALFVKTIFGPYWIKRTKTKCEFLPHYKIGDFANIKAEHWVDREIKKYKFQRVVQLYVTMFLNGQRVDWDLLGRVYKPELKYPAKYARKMFKQEKVKQMIGEKLTEALNKHGYTKDYVLSLYAKAISIAEEKKEAKNLLQAISMLEDLLEMKPAKVSTVRKIEAGYSHSIAELVESEEKNLALTETVQEVNYDTED